ncbi:MAG TPA: uracil-DNA glycosylase family protein, partial [Steroidobacteraceae bacterium]
MALVGDTIDWTNKDLVPHTGHRSPANEAHSDRQFPHRTEIMKSFATFLGEIRACSLCDQHLPLGPRPVLQVHPKARILIAGQAPGRKVHESGTPFDDASGDRLREWL